MSIPQTYRAVRYDQHGGPEVLRVEELPTPEPGAGEVLVEVRAAGINPGELAILGGAFGGDLPSGSGSDLAGVVVAVGEGVSLEVGDEVLGWSWNRDSQASHVVVPAEQLITKPAGLDWERAGALYVVGATAYAAIRAIQVSPGETVAVSAAAGGVGSLVVQMLRNHGVRVIGIASEANRGWLESKGVTWVGYGGGLADRLNEAAGVKGIDAFIDTFGPEYLKLAVEMGIAPERIETIISFEAASEYGTKAEGSMTASTQDVLKEVAEQVADGDLEVVIAATFPLEKAAEAFTRLAERHTRGKIVLIP